MLRNRRVVKANKRSSLPITNEEVEVALRNSGGIQTQAAALLSRSSQRINQMVQRSPHLRAVCDEENETIFQLARQGIKYLVKKKNLIACIYVLKALGKPEWSERSEVVSANVHANVPSGVLLLPQPAQDLQSWEKLASQWNDETKQIGYDGDAEDDEEY